MTASRLITKPSELESDFWFDNLKEHCDDDFARAVQDILNNTTEIYPGTNIVALIEKACREIKTQRVIKQRQEEAEQKRLPAPGDTHVSEETFKPIFKAMFEKTNEILDQYIDPNRMIEDEDPKKPWSQKRIELARKRSRAKTAKEKGDPAFPYADTNKIPF